MKLNIKKLIEFYDAKRNTDTKLIASLTGLYGEEMVIVLLIHHLNELGYRATLQDGTPRNTKWLDAWLTATISRRVTLLQVEVKNWSSHSLGGVDLPINALNQEVNKHGYNRLLEHYDIKTHTLGKYVDSPMALAISGRFKLTTLMN